MPQTWKNMKIAFMTKGFQEIKGALESIEAADQDPTHLGENWSRYTQLSGHWLALGLFSSQTQRSKSIALNCGRTLCRKL